MPDYSSTSFLIVDDTEAVRVFLQQTLAQLGAVEIHHAANGNNALAKFSEHLPDVVFLDIELPDLDGQTILKELKGIKPNVNVIMVTAHGSVDNVKEAISRGANGFVVKPFSPKKISSALKVVSQK
jgi:two-component system, chemotaxis family, chemotaxis protein CheY